MLGAGFRPFFLLTAFHALSGLLLWGIWLLAQSGGSGIEAITVSAPPYLWHAHEMLFGFLSAAIAGFLLTAVPNWSGTAPIQGRPLALLVSLWLLGRCAFWSSALWPSWLVVAADLPFLPVLAWMISRALHHAKGKRNMPFIPLLAVVSVANALDHASLLGLLETGALSRLIALDCVVVMMVIIGGRIAPTFSRNWLIARQRPHNVLSAKPLDVAAIASAVLVLLSDLLNLTLSVSRSPVDLDIVRGPLLVIAAGAVALRLLFWKPWRVAAEPLLWVLHLGMAWVALGFALRAFALLGPLWALPYLAESTALHAHMVGAAGTLILGVMGRASLGHSGRALTASPLMAFSYGLVSLSATVRIIGPWVWPEATSQALTGAAMAWILAFTLYLVTFIPILSRKRNFQLKGDLLKSR
jgi:uncharacterized protein involved in response to NO